MSFEMIFHFYTKNGEGKYDTDKVDTITRTTGKKSEESPLDEAAKIILSQLARRDVWVIDVEIYEFVKRKVSFKETKGGIVVKNRKYCLDQGNISSEEISDEAEPEPATVESVKSVKKAAQVGPLRFEVFRPNSGDWQVLQSKGTKMTLGKRYPILEEKIKGGIDLFFYITRDDTGQSVELNSLFFEPERRGLIGMPSNPQSDSGSLSYISGGNVNMPVLRG